MDKDKPPVDIFLHPGEFYFGGPPARVRMVLGSCVSLVFWHPRQRLGGICHYMLPSRQRRTKEDKPDGCYADEAMALMIAEIKNSGTQLRDYRVKIFGGGNMFIHGSWVGKNHIGVQNVLAARALLKAHGFECVSEHVEGFGYRNLIFDIDSGDVFVRHRALNNGARYPEVTENERD